MKTKLTILAVAMAISGVLGLADTVSSEPPKPVPMRRIISTQRLTAKFVDKAPKLDAEADWGDEGKISVLTQYGTMGKVPVTMQARNDGKYLYIKATWYDPTYSVAKKQWVYSDKAGWKQSSEDEDRFALAFNINVEKFAEKGCMSLCHKAEEYMATHNKDEKADLWHWKAGRGGRFGYADEQGFTFGEDGRSSDSGKSAYASNKQKKTPKRVWKADADKTGVFEMNTSIEMTAEYAPTDGETAPGYIFRKPDGSRADVESAAVHKNGFWTVVLKRKLVTDDEGDAKFEAGKGVLFAVSVMDNTGVGAAEDHTKSKAVQLFVESGS